MRGISIGGIAFGVLLLVSGVFVFLWSQGRLPFDLNIWAVCALGLIVLGVIVLGGVLWGRRMARGGWRRWMSDWDQGSERPPPP
jgi:hypothetical protein